MRKVDSPIYVPEVLYKAGVFALLMYRRFRYGYGFRRIPLSRGLFAIVDAEDYEALSRHKWWAQLGKHNGTFYAVRNEKRGRMMIRVWMHRVIMNAPEGLFVDHIDHNGLDNRKANLRLATPTQNGWNRVRGKRGSSRYKGVAWDAASKRWRAVLCMNYQRKHLGFYKDEKEAARVYDEAARKYKGEFAYLNFPAKE